LRDRDRRNRVDLQLAPQIGGGEGGDGVDAGVHARIVDEGEQSAPLEGFVHRCHAFLDRVRVCDVEDQCREARGA
jgi:hypothetical protein